MTVHRSLVEASEQDLEAELLRLSRSRDSGTRLQARTAAIRTVLRGRRQERQVAERRTEVEQRQKEQERLEWPSQSPDAIAGPDYWHPALTRMGRS